MISDRKISRLKEDFPVQIIENTYFNIFPPIFTF